MTIWQPKRFPSWVEILPDFEPEIGERAAIEKLNLEMHRHFLGLPYFFWLMFGLLAAYGIYLMSYPFFWDQIMLLSAPAQHFFSEGFWPATLPTEMDAGHPPLAPLYLAGVWKLLGKEIWVSHLAILPFALAAFYQFFLFAKKHLKSSDLGFALLLYLLHPTLLAQNGMISVEPILVFFFLLALNHLQKPRHLLFVVSLIVLSLLSLRGVIAVFLLFLFACNSQGWHVKRIIKSYVIPFGLSALFYALWLVHHQAHTGWYLSNPESPWASNQGFTNFAGLLKNGAVFIWRLTDFGVLPLALLGFLGLIRAGKRQPRSVLWGFGLLSLTVFILVLVPMSNPISHRYLLLVSIIMIVLGVSFWASINDLFLRRFSAGFMILCMILGHAMIYPNRIAQGWDASLAYLPYANQRTEMAQFVTQNLSPHSSVRTEFPNYHNIVYTDLYNLQDPSPQIFYHFPKFKLEESEMASYYLYSNVMNTGWFEERLRDPQQFRPVHYIDHCGVHWVLYANMQLLGDSAPSAVEVEKAMRKNGYRATWIWLFVLLGTIIIMGVLGYKAIRRPTNFLGRE